MPLRLERNAALGLACALLIAPPAAQAVNLVPNPSFESYGCPTINQTYQAHWMRRPRARRTT
jgi:hypothetical protein